MWHGTASLVRRSRWTGAPLGLALLGIVLGGYPGGSEAAPPPPHSAPPGAGLLAGRDCLVVVLDALHARELGCYGGNPRLAPHLDALADGGVRFARAWSQASWTLPSTASLFTGLYQETHGLRFGVGREDIRLAREAITLAELFAAAGYDTCAYSENVFASGHFGLDQGFQTFHDVRWGVGDMTGDIAARLQAPSARPRFTYVHYRRPHSPYDPAPEHAALFVDSTYSGNTSGSDEDVRRHNDGSARMGAADLAHHHALYAANVHHVDANLGRLLEAVDSDSTLVVVLSDHGEAFDQHGRLGHNWNSFEEYVHIPFVLSHPALPRHTVIDKPVMTIDVLPTLVDLFDLPAHDVPRQGTSLAGLLAGAGAPDRPAVFSSSRVGARGRQQLAVFDGRFKLLRLLPSATDRLFDLTADPDERHDLLATHPAAARRLARLLDDWQASQRPSLAVPANGDLDPEQLQALQEMGYFGR